VSGAAADEPRPLVVEPQPLAPPPSNEPPLAPPLGSAHELLPPPLAPAEPPRPLPEAVDHELEPPPARPEEESDEDVDDEAWERREASQREAEALRMRHILAAFTPEQLDRYECFRRSTLPRDKVRKLASAALGGKAPGDKSLALILLAGLAKTFVGELVEEGRRVASERGDTGPLRPSHVSEAHRRLEARGKTFGGRRLSSLGGKGAQARLRC